MSKQDVIQMLARERTQLSAVRLAELEYEALQAEKRDRMAARLQVWQVLMALVSAFGLASIQTGAIGYVVVLYPLLAACLARYTGHSEAVLSQLKAYLLELEKRANYAGYEHYNKLSGRNNVGSHMKALRDALIITDALAVLSVIGRMIVDHWYVPAGLVVLTAIFELVVTCRWLNSGRSRKSVDTRDAEIQANGEHPDSGQEAQA
jgi:hypothetical protein